MSDSKIWYVAESGFIEADGEVCLNDRAFDESTVLEQALEAYKKIDLAVERKETAELVADDVTDCIFFKRILAEKQSEPDNYVLDSVTIIEEKEGGMREPAVSSIADLGDVEAMIAKLK